MHTPSPLMSARAALSRSTLLTLTLSLACLHLNLNPSHELSLRSKGALAQGYSASEIEVSLGGSSLFKLGIGAKKITLTDPSIAEVSVVQDKLLLIGRKVGETNLVAYNDTESETYLIKVSLPARRDPK